MGISFLRWNSLIVISTRGYEPKGLDASSAVIFSQEKARVQRLRIQHQATLVNFNFIRRNGSPSAQVGKLIGMWIVVACGHIHWRITVARSQNKTRAYRQIIAAAALRVCGSSPPPTRTCGSSSPRGLIRSRSRSRRRTMVEAEAEAEAEIAAARAY